MGFWKPDSRPDDGVLCPSVKVEGLRVLQRERGDGSGGRQRKKKREKDVSKSQEVYVPCNHHYFLVSTQSLHDVQKFLFFWLGQYQLRHQLA